VGGGASGGALVFCFSGPLAASTGTRTKWPINDVFVPTMTLLNFGLFVLASGAFNFEKQKINWSNLTGTR